MQSLSAGLTGQTGIIASPLAAISLDSGDDVDFAGPDLGEKLLQGRAVKGGTGKGAIIIALLDQAPSFVRLAFDIGLTSLALGCLYVTFGNDCSRRY